MRVVRRSTTEYRDSGFIELVELLELLPKK
jgi:hypothetical protein